MKKKHLYEWIILFLFLIPACIISAIVINKILLFMTETPLYTNLSRYDKIDMSVSLPESWHFSNDDDCFYLTNNAGTENLYITEVQSATSMDVAKEMFLLSFKNSYSGDLDYKEGTIDGNTEIYYVTYTQYSDYYVSGVISNNGIYANFSYKTSLNNNNMSPLSTILSSVKLSKVVDTTQPKTQDN